ncbi:MAG: hypothetical protein OHK0047_22210 [Leptolyngbyaceae cyanobacterium]
MNVVVSLHEQGFRSAFKVLQGFGSVNTTNFFNVLGMQVENIPELLEALRDAIAQAPEQFAFLARLVPVTTTFTFQSPAEFEAKAKEAVFQWIPQLAGKRFHIRMHRRGFKGRLSSHDEERFLDEMVLQALEQAGTPGTITFQDPDAIVVVETVGQWCGLSYWTREELQRYPFLRID